MSPALRRRTSAPVEPTTYDGAHLVVRDLSVRLRSRGREALALDAVSLTVDRGETLALLGESGSGKSMTGLALMGLVPPHAGSVVGGEVRLAGRDITNLGAEEWSKVRGERIAMVFQDPLSSLNPVMTVGYQIGETFRRHRGVSRKEARARAVELMDRVHIPAARSRVDDYPHQFSGGMRQRVLVAMALALDPEVLIADEPTTALDATVQAQIMRLLADLQREQEMALVLISHDLGVVADVADTVAVMYGGRIVESGQLEPVYRDSAHPYTQGLLSSIPRTHSSGTRLTPIAGSPPDLFALPSGCAFHPRCPHREDRCTTETPGLRTVHDNHLSACHFAERVLADSRDREGGDRHGAAGDR